MEGTRAWTALGHREVPKKVPTAPLSKAREKLAASEDAGRAPSLVCACCEHMSQERAAASRSLQDEQELRKGAEAALCALACMMNERAAMIGRNARSVALAPVVERRESLWSPLPPACAHAPALVTRCALDSIHLFFAFRKGEIEKITQCRLCERDIMNMILYSMVHARAPRGVPVGPDSVIKTYRYIRQQHGQWGANQCPQASAASP